MESAQSAQSAQTLIRTRETFFLPFVDTHEKTHIPTAVETLCTLCTLCTSAAPREFNAGEAYRESCAVKPKVLDQTERIRVLAVAVAPGELANACERVKPVPWLSALDRHELALLLALLDKGISPDELLVVECSINLHEDKLCKAA
jgi:hypothetical protein